MAESFALSYNIAGEQQMQRSFSRFSEHMSDLHEPFEDIAGKFLEIEEAQFASEGSRGGHWKGLSDEYAAWKAKHYPGAPIMVREGTLKASLTGGAGKLKDVQAQTLTLGSTIPYAIYHQEGRGNLPQRKLVHLTEEDKLDWSKTIHKWVIKKLKKEFSKR